MCEDNLQCEIFGIFKKNEMASWNYSHINSKLANINDI